MVSCGVLSLMSLILHIHSVLLIERERQNNGRKQTSGAKPSLECHSRCRLFGTTNDDDSNDRRISAFLPSVNNNSNNQHVGGFPRCQELIECGLDCLIHSFFHTTRKKPIRSSILVSSDCDVGHYSNEKDKGVLLSSSSSSLSTTRQVPLPQCGRRLQYEGKSLKQNKQEVIYSYTYS